MTKFEAVIIYMAANAMRDVRGDGKEFSLDCKLFYLMSLLRYDLKKYRHGVWRGTAMSVAVRPICPRKMGYGLNQRRLEQRLEPPVKVLHLADGIQY